MMQDDSSMMKAVLLEKLEASVGSDWFEMDSEEIMSLLEGVGAGPEIIGDLLGIMERHPLDDFGMPGAMVHYIENYYPDYLPQLVDSVQRAPALATVWMLHRCMNGSQDKAPLLRILTEVANNGNADNTIREQARSLLEDA